MSLHYEILDEGNNAKRVKLVGRLDTETSPALLSDLESELGATSHVIVFDLEALDYISSAGLRVLFWAKRSQEEGGGRIALVGAQPPVRKVLDIVKAVDVMEVFDSWDEMDRYLDHVQKQAGSDDTL